MIYFNDRDANLIVSIPIRQSDADSWYWSKEKMGVYTVKSTYETLQEKEIVAVQVITPNFG